MTLYTEERSNRLKTWGIMTAFLVGIILFGYILARASGEPLILYFAVGISLLLNWSAYWYSDKIVLSLSGAKPALREEYFDLYTIVENLSITAGLPMPKVYVMTDRSPNAFATGRDKEHAVVAVTTGLLDILEKNELEGVLAHELSHIGNRDILLSTIVVVLAGFVSILSDYFLRSGRIRSSDDDNKAMQGIAIVVAILAPFAATLIRYAVSRKREFLADSSGALLTRYPEGLASALEKIKHANIPLARANTATAHLFFANPFRQGNLSGLSRLFLTHPPIDERITALRDRSGF